MEPTLYILMRSDIQDMNPGKAMAQAAHAQADFDACIEDMCGPDYTQDDPLWRAVNYWRGLDRNFGRTIVLEATEERIRSVTDTCAHGGYTVDPTYPWHNYYNEVFVSEELTCGWVFIGDDNVEDKALIADLKLHR